MTSLRWADNTPPRPSTDDIGTSFPIRTLVDPVGSASLGRRSTHYQPKKMKITVIVCTFNRSQQLEKPLEEHRMLGCSQPILGSETF
jgi:hypothetical protein